MTQDVLEPKTELAVIETKIAEYKPTAQGLAELKHRFANLVFDLSTTKGEKEARAARLELVKLRSGLEAKRVEIKAPALERSRLIDAEAARLKLAIAELEDPIDEQIKAEEERREAEKQTKIEAEARRVAEIRERISMMSAMAVRAVGQPSASIEEKIKLVVAIDVGDAFAEFAAEARLAQVETLGRLRELFAAAVASEEREARAAAERIELDRLRAEDAERRRQDEARAAAERKAEDDRLATARREIEARERAQREEQARLDAEAAAERRRADDEARAQRAEDDRIAREARAAEERCIQAVREAVERQREEQRAADQRRLDEERAAERIVMQEREAAARRAEVARSKLHAGAEALLAAAIEAAGALQGCVEILQKIETPKTAKAVEAITKRLIAAIAGATVKEPNPAKKGA